MSRRLTVGHERTSVTGDEAAGVMPHPLPHSEPPTEAALVHVHQQKSNSKARKGEG